MQSIFPLSQKKSHFAIFTIETRCKTKKTNVNSIYIVGSCLQGKQMVFSCLLLLRTWVSTQIMVCDCCIAKCKNVSACGRLLMALWAISFLIKNI